LLLWIQTSQAASSRTYTLYHDISGNGSFTKRSTVTLATRGKEVLETSIENLAAILEPDWINSLVDKRAFYTLKLIDDSQDSAVAITSVPACSLRRAHFREALEIMVDSTGTLMSMGYMPIVSPLAPVDCFSMSPLTSDETTLEFKSRISLERPLQAIPVPLVFPSQKPPPGLSFFPTAKPANPDEKEPISQQSILMRYWYIILPLVLVGMFGGGEEPPQQQSSTSQPQRRSKRD